VIHLISVGVPQSKLIVVRLSKASFLVARAGLLAFFSAAIAASLSCGGSDLLLPSDTGPGGITLVRGDGQSGPAGAELGDALVVKVVDRRGEPLSDQRVVFRLGTDVPGARVSPDTAQTNGDGLAETRWVLGSTVGTQTVIARVVGANGLEVTFSASVGTAGATTIERASGDNQSARVGDPLPDELVVRVIDAFGNPISGVSVEWSASQGSVAPGSTVTEENGRAATSWTLGMTTGEQTVTASSAGLEGSPLQFTAFALSGDASSLVRVSGNSQTARAGTELPEPLRVRLTDRDGNSVPNRAVSWVIATGGGSVSSENTLTGPDGIASTRWTLGANPGGNSLNAVASGVGVVSFTATATGGGGGGGGGGGSSASRLAFVAQPSDVEEDKRLEPPVRVAVLDEDGDVVTQGSFEVKLELVGGDDDAELKGKDKKKTNSGIATFDDIKVNREGHYRLRASTGGLPSADSNEFEVEED
jgi:Bacterial Ig-like domain (group 1)